VSEEGDATLDELSAQVRSIPRLREDEVARLLPQAGASGPAQERLVEDHLGVVFDAALARRDRGVDVVDLYQEGTLAAIVAVAEYSSRGGAPAGLRAYVARVVGTHLDDTLEQADLERRADEAFVRDAQLYETAEVGLRHKLERAPTTTELAAVLEWPEERVEVVADAVNNARQIWDQEITQYLDDDD